MYELIVDSFAGGGGASTGIEAATGRPVDIAINHDMDAIRMHKANHPQTKHFCENIWQVNPKEATQGKPVALAWFSPDCKHFSKAKGGRPVSKNIRGLAWVVLRWAAAVKPRVIIVENVEEFTTWCPVRKGKPVKRKKGETFAKWKKQLEALGYEVKHMELRACDYGAPTIRKRFFLIARCDGKKIVFPDGEYVAPDTLLVAAGAKKPYRTAADIIDWSIPCSSIFERKRPLAENTMRRIAKGIQKFVIENPDPFIIQVNHSGDRFRGQSVDEPLQTITAKHGYGIVAPTIAQIGQTGGGDRARPADAPLSTIVSKNEHCLVEPLLIQYHGETSSKEVRGQELKKPIMTVDTNNRYALVTAFISKYFAGGYQGAGSAVSEPLPTITTIDHNSIVTSNLMILRNNEFGQDEREPLKTICTSPGHFAEVRAFLLKYYGEGIGQNIKKPLDTITTKDRFALVTIHGVDYAIVDIGMRMLTPRELFNAQGFPADYIIDRDADGNTYSQSKQVARCGNSVSPHIPEALVRANLPELCTKEVKTA